MLRIFLGSLFYLLYVTYAQEDNTGDIVDMDTHDPKYWKLAEESLNKYSLKKPLPNHQVISVDRATEQVVEGLITRLDFTIAILYYKQYAPDYKCHSKIWEKPWENFKSIDVDCKVIWKSK